MSEGRRRILLIQDRRMGDVVLTTALLEDLAAASPDAAIDFMVGAPAAPLLLHHPLIDEVVILDKDHVVGTWRAVRARGYDLVVDVQGNTRTAMITRASGAPVRAGWKGAGRSWMYTHRVEREHDLRYVVHDRQRLLQAVGIPTAALLPRLHLTDAERAAGAEVIRGLGVDTAQTVVGVMLSSRGPERDWPVRHFVELSRLLAETGVVIVLFPGGQDDARVEEFRASGGRAVIAPNVAIRPLMALISACALFISPDTGPAHIATALGVPRITLFGPSSPRGWSPGLPTTVALRSGGDAGGPMEDLQPDLVLRATLDVLSRESAG
jgi:ADP-heptose:LPS heptosyltransferase